MTVTYTKLVASGLTDGLPPDDIDPIARTIAGLAVESGHDASTTEELVRQLQHSKNAGGTVEPDRKVMGVSMSRGYEVIGRSVKWYRESELKISAPEFAGQCGIPPQVLEQIETGDCEQCLGELILISINSDFPLDDVIDDALEHERLHSTKTNDTIAMCLVEKYAGE